MLESVLDSNAIVSEVVSSGASLQAIIICFVVAILGAFSLVRFRTIPGSSKEIAAIFFAMTVGLSMGMGYVFYAVMLTGIVGILV